MCTKLQQRDIIHQKEEKIIIYQQQSLYYYVQELMTKEDSNKNDSFNTDLAANVSNQQSHSINHSNMN